MVERPETNTGEAAGSTPAPPTNADVKRPRGLRTFTFFFNFSSWSIGKGLYNPRVAS